jgi:2'-5' RNA ligase
MSRPTRTFVAIPIPADRADRLARLQTLIAPTLTGARWEEPSKFHLTLAFLGDVPDIDLNPLCKAVAEAVKGYPPLAFTITRLGVFPDAQRPRVVWAGLVGENLERLDLLRASVVKAVASVGYTPEDDRFTPHITIGRLKPGRESTDDCTPLLRHYERWSAGPFTATEVITYASQFTPEGPAYVALGRAPLKGRA